MSQCVALMTWVRYLTFSSIETSGALKNSSVPITREASGQKRRQTFVYRYILKLRPTRTTYLLVRIERLLFSPYLFRHRRCGQRGILSRRKRNTPSKGKANIFLPQISVAYSMKRAIITRVTGTSRERIHIRMGFWKRWSTHGLLQLRRIHEQHFYSVHFQRNSRRVSKRRRIFIVGKRQATLLTVFGFCSQPETVVFGRMRVHLGHHVQFRNSGPR